MLLQAGRFYAFTVGTVRRNDNKLLILSSSSRIQIQNFMELTCTILITEDILDFPFLLGFLHFKLRRQLPHICPTTTLWSTCPNGRLRHYCIKELRLLPTMFRQEIPGCKKGIPQMFFPFLHHSIDFGTTSSRIDGIINRTWSRTLRSCLGLVRVYALHATWTRR